MTSIRKGGATPGGSIVAGSIKNAQISASAAIALSKLQAGTYTRFSPSDQTTTSTAALVMAGMGATISFTPSKTGTILIVITGSIRSDTTGDGAQSDGIRYGPGAAPVNGAALAGTRVNNTIYPFVSADPLGNSYYPFCIFGVVTGLMLSTAYWIDMSLEAITGGQARFTNVEAWVLEANN